MIYRLEGEQKVSRCGKRGYSAFDPAQTTRCGVFKLEIRDLTQFESGCRLSQNPQDRPRALGFRRFALEGLWKVNGR
jgi:hypothetical protein